jgi:hypothetical protein
MRFLPMASILLTAASAFAQTAALPPPLAQVVRTIPAQDARDVSVDTTFTVTFSEGMNPSTINSSSFRLAHGSTTVSGSITYDPATFAAILKPSARLKYRTRYTATINITPPRGVQDAYGRLLPAPGVYAWRFITEKAPQKH